MASASMPSKTSSHTCAGPILTDFDAVTNARFGYVAPAELSARSPLNSNVFPADPGHLGHQCLHIPAIPKAPCGLAENAPHAVRLQFDQKVRELNCRPIPPTSNNTGEAPL